VGFLVVCEEGQKAGPEGNIARKMKEGLEGNERKGDGQ
jgi:hypothetical protein